MLNNICKSWMHIHIIHCILTNNHVKLSEIQLGMAWRSESIIYLYTKIGIAGRNLSVNDFYHIIFLCWIRGGGGGGWAGGGGEIALISLILDRREMLAYSRLFFTFSREAKLSVNDITLFFFFFFFFGGGGRNSDLPYRRILCCSKRIRTTPHQDYSSLYRYWSWWGVLFRGSGPSGEVSWWRGVLVANSPRDCGPGGQWLSFIFI